MNTNPLHFDVVIVGGGAAGCAASLTLTQHSKHQVLLIERDDTQVHVGESVPPSIIGYLDYLAITPSFLAANYHPVHGVATAWGQDEVIERPFLMTGQGHGWHLDRKHFDQMLRDKVEQYGATIYSQSRVLAIEPMAPIERSKSQKPPRWQVSLKTGQQTQVISCNYVIDASGRSAVFAQQFGAISRRQDDLVGVVGFYQFDDTTAVMEPGSFLLESGEYGWWYSAMLPNRKMVVALMSDADIISQQRLKIKANWQRLLTATVTTSKRVKGAVLDDKLLARPAYSHYLSKDHGPGWVAVGDAVAAYDPLTSMGIAHALFTGIHGGRIAAHEVGGKPIEGDIFSQEIERNFNQYMALRQQHYQVEQRWRHSVFWQRRQQ